MQQCPPNPPDPTKLTTLMLPITLTTPTTPTTPITLISNKTYDDRSAKIPVPNDLTYEELTDWISQDLRDRAHPAKLLEPRDVCMEVLGAIDMNHGDQACISGFNYETAMIIADFVRANGYWCAVEPYRIYIRIGETKVWRGGPNVRVGGEISCEELRVHNNWKKLVSDVWRALYHNKSDPIDTSYASQRQRQSMSDWLTRCGIKHMLTTDTITIPVGQWDPVLDADDTHTTEEDRGGICVQVKKYERSLNHDNQQHIDNQRFDTTVTVAN